MKQRGRTSTAALSVVPVINVGRTRLQPPAHLTREERTLFLQVVTENDPAHFAATDAILLASFVQASLLVRRMSKAVSKNPDPKTVQSWERALRSQAMLATRLRLAPQSRMHQRQAGRLASQAAVDPALWGED
jgi:cellobiose-specific phosphotransferase system component IIB